MTRSANTETIYVFKTVLLRDAREKREGGREYLEEKKLNKSNKHTGMKKKVYTEVGKQDNKKDKRKIRKIRKRGSV